MQLLVDLMTRDEERESRTILRRIDAHLRQSHLDMGAQEETVGFVDVLHHPQRTLPILNYVTPRKNTAWVSSNHIQQGLEQLTAHERIQRVRFADGLFPPVFMKTLRMLGLEAEDEIPLMVYKHDEKTPRKLPARVKDVSFVQAETAQDLAIWWYVWRNAHYDVAASSVEPLLIGRDLQEVYFKRQINLTMYRNNYPMGALRLTLHEKTAHIVAHALLKEMRGIEWDQILRLTAIHTAIDAGTNLVFVTGKAEDERQQFRELGFVDAGSIISYAEKNDTRDSDEDANDAVAQSVYIVS
ncbi:MAG: hypothetical protein AAFV98_07135 [Chloroflexota bacterium]